MSQYEELAMAQNTSSVNKLWKKEQSTSGSGTFMSLCISTLASS